MVGKPYIRKVWCCKPWQTYRLPQRPVCWPLQAGNSCGLGRVACSFSCRGLLRIVRGRSFLIPLSESLLCLGLLSGRQQGGHKPSHKHFKRSTSPCEVCAEMRPGPISPWVAFLEFLGLAPPMPSPVCFALGQTPLILSFFLVSVWTGLTFESLQALWCCCWAPGSRVGRRRCPPPTWSLRSAEYFHLCQPWGLEISRPCPVGLFQGPGSLLLALD